MQMDAGWARQRFGQARVARLATVDDEGRPHLVPIVFAVIAEAICFAVDNKPKTGAPLRRLANIAAHPEVSMLVDFYSDDWDQLWWARADGTARILDQGDAELAALAGRYAQYQQLLPPGPVVRIDVSRWSGWAASPS
jgi:PPOX class probable F420-dependent enzyme